MKPSESKCVQVRIQARGYNPSQLEETSTKLCIACALAQKMIEMPPQEQIKPVRGWRKEAEPHARNRALSTSARGLRCPGTPPSTRAAGPEEGRQSQIRQDLHPQRMSLAQARRLSILLKRGFSVRLLKMSILKKLPPAAFLCQREKGKETFFEFLFKIFCPQRRPISPCERIKPL